MVKRILYKNKIFVFVIFILNFVFFLTKITSNKSENIENNIEQHNSVNNIISGYANIIDGDSLEINKKQVRLNKIDATEINQLCFDDNDMEYFCGRESKEFLTKMTKDKIITCFSDKKDQYGRYLSMCYVDKININYSLLENGMAIIYNIHNASKEEIYLESEARKKRLGVWQGKFKEPKQYRKDTIKK